MKARLERAEQELRDSFDRQALEGFAFAAQLSGHNVQLVEPRERLATWMIANGFATGHGDTMEDLLRELTWQIEELRSKRLA